MTGESDWEPVCTVDTPAAHLPAIARRFAEAAIDDLRAQLAANPVFTPAVVAAIVAKAAPLIHDTTAEQLTKGWLALQTEAGRIQ